MCNVCLELGLEILEFEKKKSVKLKTTKFLNRKNKAQTCTQRTSNMFKESNQD